jgi:hypothetical protein
VAREQCSLRGGTANNRRSDFLYPARKHLIRNQNSGTLTYLKRITIRKKNGIQMKDFGVEVPAVLNGYQWEVAEDGLSNLQRRQVQRRQLR